MTRKGADENLVTTGTRAPQTGAREPAARVPAWEEIEDGRYMPRRTRGSYPGRELG